MKTFSISLASACALVLSVQAFAATPAPKPAVAAKILPTAKLNALTGGNFAPAPLAAGEPALPASAEQWNGTATDYATDPSMYSQNPYAHDLTLNIVAGPTQVNRMWATYSHPRRVSDAINAVSGIGTKAVEVNDYIVVVKGNYAFQMWAGNNGGQHLSYPQLETVAKYIVAHLPK